MALTVLQVGYPLAPVTPDAVGGAEQVLALCDRAVVAAGHRSEVVAPAGSEVAGALIALPAVPDVLDDAVRERAQAATRHALAERLRRGDVDVVHLHGVDFARTLPPDGVPALVTLHLPPSLYDGPLAPPRPDTHLVAVSDAQRRSLPPELPVTLVPNGVDLDRWRPGGAPEDYVLALGRLCPEKGFDLAVEAAVRADLPLLLAGRVFGYEAHRAWVDRCLLPRLDARRRLLGPVGGEAKRRLLAGARCVVVPSQVPETSCLVAMEALACGTPVVAWRVGALPELVEHGRTGLLVDDLDGLVEALRDVRLLDRRACRAAAEARCSGADTAARYLDLYRALARRPRSLPRPDVEVVTEPSRLEALPWDELVARSGAGAFLRPGWLLPWVRVFRPTLRCLALWRGGRLDGLLPLQLDGGWLKPIGLPHSDRHDALLAGDPLDDAARLLQAAAALDGWTHLALPELAEGSPLRVTPAPAGLASTVVADGVSPAVPLDPTDPWRGVPRRLRQNVRTARHRVAREHRSAVHEGTAADLDAHLDVLLALHGARWAARDEPGMLADPDVARFVRAACPALLAEGVLRLWTLELDGRPAAALLALRDGDALAYWLAGFDPAWRAVSPGSLVVAHALERAAAEGARSLDFLRGDEPYKRAWGAVPRRLWRRTLTREPA